MSVIRNEILASNLVTPVRDVGGRPFAYTIMFIDNEVNNEFVVTCDLVVYCLKISHHTSLFHQVLQSFVTSTTPHKLTADKPEYTFSRSPRFERPTRFKYDLIGQTTKARHRKEDARGGSQNPFFSTSTR